MPAPAKSRIRWLGRALEALALLILAALAFWPLPSIFPPGPPAAQQTPEGAVRAYAIGRKAPPDYFTVQNADGRIFRIGFDSNGDGKPDTFINLDEIPLAGSLHFVLLLDGVPYNVVEAYRRKGGLRLFHPPSRVVSVYPAYTALAFADVFAEAPPTAFEAIYYSHRLNKIAGGDIDYLSMANEPWIRNCDYRLAAVWDPFAYLVPEKVFQRELGDVRGLLAGKDRGVLVAYLVSTAGVATREGEAGILRVLDETDRLCEELIWRTRGRAKITVFSDHGHTMTPCKRVDFRPLLTAKGWQVSDHLDGPRAVVQVEYGLVTTAIFATQDRAGLAADLATCQGVRFASYFDGAAVAVRAAGGLTPCRATRWGFCRSSPSSKPRANSMQMGSPQTARSSRPPPCTCTPTPATASGARSTALPRNPPMSSPTWTGASSPAANRWRRCSRASPARTATWSALRARPFSCQPSAPCRRPSATATFPRSCSR
ncbi:MAG: hypothetical protein NT049_12200 [Planctomycetota bacterium]|nr:hypothetical protein [Planctomycetota bacterium]